MAYELPRHLTPINLSRGHARQGTRRVAHEDRLRIQIGYEAMQFNWIGFSEHSTAEMVLHFYQLCASVGLATA
jgi:hypothetical protein